MPCLGWKLCTCDHRVDAALGPLALDAFPTAEVPSETRPPGPNRAPDLRVTSKTTGQGRSATRRRRASAVTQRIAPAGDGAAAAFPPTHKRAKARSRAGARLVLVPGGHVRPT